jgi:type IV pilus assembly protein PilP
MPTVKTYSNIVLGILLATGLQGCSQSNQDLRDYIDEIKSQPTGDIPPIPVIPPYDPFEYPEHFRDPFDASIVAPDLQPMPQSTSGIRIDKNRAKEYLESFPLDALHMVGTMQQNGSLWALLKTPDGTIQRTRVGNYAGQNYGRITKITDMKVELIEIVPDGFGGYKERPASIALSNQ